MLTNNTLSPVPVMSELADMLEENYKQPFHTLVLFFLLFALFEPDLPSDLCGETALPS